MSIQKHIENGYRIDNEGKDYITLRKSKSWGVVEVLMIIIGIPLLFAWGIGGLLWILAILSYAFKKDQFLTIKK